MVDTYYICIYTHIYADSDSNNSVHLLSAGDGSYIFMIHTLTHVNVLKFRGPSHTTALCVAWTFTWELFASWRIYTAISMGVHYARKNVACHLQSLVFTHWLTRMAHTHTHKHYTHMTTSVEKISWSLAFENEIAIAMFALKKCRVYFGHEFKLLLRAGRRRIPVWHGTPSSPLRYPYYIYFGELWKAQNAHKVSCDADSKHVQETGEWYNQS